MPNGKDRTGLVVQRNVCMSVFHWGTWLISVGRACLLHGSGASAPEPRSERMDFGGEIKLFPPHTYHGELEKRKDWSWQLKRYVGLYKAIAKLMIDDVEGSSVMFTDGLYEGFDVQQKRAQNNQLSLFSKQLAYMLAQVSDGAGSAIVRDGTQRMDSRFGADCTSSSDCPKEREPRAF